MTTDESRLGTCPDCGAAIPTGRLLIAYRREGRRASYAECPACLGVVRPRRRREPADPRSGRRAPKEQGR